MIHFSNNIQDALDSLLIPGRYDAVFALTDSNTKPLGKDALARWVPDAHFITIPTGDESKTLNIATQVWNHLIEHNATRKSCLINVGGGVVSDLGGFCAATYMRGIAFINIPTSLLAMVDASVGAKNGINMGSMKNYVGTFTDPLAVIIHSHFLKTLEPHHMINGWAEVIKHAIIGGGELWKMTKTIPPIEDERRWNDLIEANIQIKKNIVETDMHEAGLRKVLNLGHTVGHAIESWHLMKGKHIEHGQAVAAGIRIESAIAVDIHVLSQQTYAEIESRIDAVFERISMNKEDFSIIIDFLRKDKKNAFGKINMSLPCDIGTVQFDIPVELDIVQHALLNYAITAGSTSI